MTGDESPRRTRSTAIGVDRGGDAQSVRLLDWLAEEFDQRIADTGVLYASRSEKEFHDTSSWFARRLARSLTRQLRQAAVYLWKKCRSVADATNPKRLAWTPAFGVTGGFMDSRVVVGSGFRGDDRVTPLVHRDEFGGEFSAVTEAVTKYWIHLEDE